MITPEDYTFIAKYDNATSPEVRDRLLRHDEMEVSDAGGSGSVALLGRFCA